MVPNASKGSNSDASGPPGGLETANSMNSAVNCTSTASPGSGSNGISPHLRRSANDGPNAHTLRQVTSVWRLSDKS
jgi:hypothetical protein